MADFISNAINAVGLSGGTIYSGTTELSLLFALQANAVSLAQLATLVRISGSTMTGGLITPSLSATTLSASTINSGSTNLYNIFAPIGAAVNYQPQIDTKVNKSGDTMTGTLYGTSISANTFTATTAAYVTRILINTGTTSGTNPERVIIDDGTTNTFSNVLVGRAKSASYAQLNIQNYSAGTNSSSDIVATADNGNESVFYVDLGINSSVFGGTLGGPNDGYLYGTGNHMWLGNATTNKNLYLFTDGTTADKIRVTINSGSTSFNVPISANTISANTITISGSSIAPSLVGGKMYCFNNFI